MDLSLIAFLPWVATVVTVAALPAFRFARFVRRRVGEDRNRRVRCARCDAVFPGLDDVHLFEGRYVCGDCADRLHQRVRLLAYGVGAAGALALLAGAGTMLVDVLWLGGGDWWAWHRVMIMFAPPALLSIGAHRSLRRLTEQNQQEQVAAAPAAGVLPR